MVGFTKGNTPTKAGVYIIKTATGIMDAYYSTNFNDWSNDRMPVKTEDVIAYLSYEDIAQLPVL